MGFRGRAKARARNERKQPNESYVDFRKRTAKPKRVRRKKEV